MATPTKRRRKPRQSDTPGLWNLSTAGEALGVHRDTIRRLLMQVPPDGKIGGHQGWKQTTVKRVVDAWRAERQTDDGMRKEERRLKVRRLELEVEELEKSVISIQDAGNRLSRMASRVRAILVQQIGTELPAQILQGLPAAGVRGVCEGAVNASLAELARTAEEWKIRD
jgi:hypothetical protein